MPATRRAFLGTLTAGTAAVLGGACATRSTAVVPAAAPSAAAPEQALIRLGSNENGYGPGPAAREAIARALGVANRYAFGAAGELRAAVAAHAGVDASQVVTACGSSELLDAAVSAFTSRDGHLVTAAPTFESPAYRAQGAGARVVAVPVDAQGRLDFDATLAASTGAGLVYVCNPNNPTGTVHGAGDVRALVEAVVRRSPGTAVLVDEAYHEYVAAPDYATAIPLALAHPRVIVTRTFSKIHGMAGLRAGYAVGQSSSLREMVPWMSTEGMSIVAAEAARAALADVAYVEQQRALNAEARRMTLAALERAGCRAFESHGNFLMADVGRDCREFAASCAARGVRIARPFPPLLHHARITFGTVEEMTRAVDVFSEVLAEQPRPSAALWFEAMGDRPREC